MEIPEINMISDFQAGMKCLENPSSISKFFSFPGIFFKWGALIFAIFATFSSVMRRIKLVFIRFHAVKQPYSTLHDQKEEINDFSEDDDVSLASSDDEQGEIEEEKTPRTTSFSTITSHRCVDEDFSVKGFRWPEFTCGKSVVKLWDLSLGLSLDFDEDLINYGSNDVVSLWEREYSGNVWNLPSTGGKGNRVVLCGYDARMRRRIPALSGEWRSTTEEVDGMSNGAVSRVYVRDDVSGVVTVGDVRNMRMPLGRMRESNAVIVE